MACWHAGMPGRMLMLYIIPGINLKKQQAQHNKKRNKKGTTINT